MNLDLSDEEATALATELARIIENDRFPLSPRIQVLKAMLTKLRPEPVREPLPEPKRYAPPKAAAAGRRCGGSLRSPAAASRRNSIATVSVLSQCA
jgi:hypothetical protein